MGWFSKFIGKFVKANDSDTRIGYFSEINSFGSVSSEAEFNATYCNCAAALARHLSKIQVGVVNNLTSGASFKYLNKILKLKPNPIQTASSFYYSLAHSYFTEGIALAYIEWDTSDVTQTRVKHLWPISNSNIRDIKLSDQNVFFSFALDGVEKIDSLDNFIALIRSPRMSNPFNTHDSSMRKIIEILATNEEGIVKAIENSNVIRFIVSSAGNMSEKMVRENQKQFDKRLEEAKSILYVTNAENLTQVNNQSKWATSDDVKEMKKEVYNFFGVNEAFLNSTYDENSWQSVYDGALEPFVTALSQELTSKLFSNREIDVGNRIEVITTPLQTASLSTRIKIAEAYLKLPTIRPNVVCDLLYLPKLEAGDKEVQSLNFVSANKVDTYQGVGNSNEEVPDGNELNNSGNKEGEKQDGTPENKE